MRHAVLSHSRTGALLVGFLVQTVAYASPILYNNSNPNSNATLWYEYCTGVARCRKQYEACFAPSSCGTAKHRTPSFGIHTMNLQAHHTVHPTYSISTRNHITPKQAFLVAYIVAGHTSAWRGHPFLPPLMLTRFCDQKKMKKNTRKKELSKICQRSSRCWNLLVKVLFLSIPLRIAWTIIWFKTYVPSISFFPVFRINHRSIYMYM